MLHVGVDVGGTFTDLFAWDPGSRERRRVREAKVLSTPDDPSVGFMRALEAAQVDPSEIGTVVHGTTIATNALIERRYPEPALVTTEGFRDVLEIGRQRRRLLYDPYQSKSPPLIARSRRFTIGEKLGADGATVRPVDADGTRRVAERIAEQGNSNVAVAFINAYVDGRHELFVALDADPGAVETLIELAGEDAFVGLSDTAAGPSRVPDAAREALWALRAARALGRRMVPYGEHDAPFMPKSIGEAGVAVQRLFGPLLEYDREHNGELVASLDAFLAENRSWQRAVRRLFIHKQTLVYRMKRVEELTGRRLDDTGDVAELWFALRALERVGSPTRPAGDVAHVSG